MSVKKAVYYMCNEEDGRGLVGKIVWDTLNKRDDVANTGMSFAGREVMSHRDERGNEYYFVPTEVPLCWNYPKYLQEMNEKFSDFDMSGVVTWHEGANAPSKILTVHSIGDVNSGVYGPANPNYMRNLLKGLEKNRLKFGLEDYKTVTEATHWSGTYISGSSPELILRYRVPMVDIEVGSDDESWSDRSACRVLAEALTDVFEDDGKHIHNILCLGGVHFDPNFAQAVFTEWEEDAFGVSHIIANQWLVSGRYEEKHGAAFVDAAVSAIAGGIEAIVFHDKMKGCYKDLARALGKKYGVPIFKHQRLRKPDEIDWSTE